MVAPIAVDPILGLDYSPIGQVRRYVRFVRRHRLPVRYVLVDAGYDGREVRVYLANQRLRCAIRMGRGHEGAKVIQRLDGGGLCSLKSLIQETFRRGQNQIWTKRGDDRRWDRVMAYPVRFGLEPADYALIVQVGVKRGPDGHLEPDDDRIAIFRAPPGSSVKQARVLYGRRWSIETQFQIMAESRPKPRPKTIHSHVIQWAALLLLKAFGAIVAELLQRDRPGHLWTVKEGCDFVLMYAFDRG